MGPAARGTEQELFSHGHTFLRSIDAATPAEKQLHQQSSVMRKQPNEHRLPGFLIIGAMKAGTTTLFHDLKAQKRVFIHSDKEPHTLLKHVGDDDAVRLEYRRLLEPAGSDDLCGDASTGYSKLPVHTGVVERAVRVLGPQLRVVYVVRNPVDRMLSHYHHAVTEKSFTGSLKEAIDSLPGLVEFSCYGLQIAPWIAALGDDRVKVIVFEDYISNRSEKVAEVCRFLNIDFDPARVSDERHNASDGKPLIRGFLARQQFFWPYRRLIRPLLTPEMRIRIVKRLAPRAPGRNRKMPRTVYERIATRLAADEALLAESAGLEQPIFTPLDFVEDSPSGNRATTN